MAWYVLTAGALPLMLLALHEEVTHREKNTFVGLHKVDASHFKAPTPLDDKKGRLRDWLFPGEWAGEIEQNKVVMVEEPTGESYKAPDMTIEDEVEVKEEVKRKLKERFWKNPMQTKEYQKIKEPRKRSLWNLMRENTTIILFYAESKTVDDILVNLVESRVRSDPYTGKYLLLTVRVSENNGDKYNAAKGWGGSQRFIDWIEQGKPHGIVFSHIDGFVASLPSAYHVEGVPQMSIIANDGRLMWNFFRTIWYHRKLKKAEEGGDATAALLEEADEATDANDGGLEEAVSMREEDKGEVDAAQVKDSVACVTVDDRGDARSE